MTRSANKPVVEAMRFSAAAAQLCLNMNGCRSPWPRRSVEEANGGFTLLEVLIAFIIMSLVLAALLKGGIGGVHNAEAASLTEQAVSIARSQLSDFDATPDHAAADLQGDEGPYHWRLQIAPRLTIPVAAGGRQRSHTTLYDVAVTVSWQASGRRSSVRLDTSRLTPVPPIRP